ncbi:glycosyltransferase family 2 protein [Lactimicrobium sp.]|jgi:glycosyltransferase involved in cell wall biosynthesis|uniref:glycosyltransferase family 2 protein n=1 Tax=Lactimicrobium sp. TaxID=2563780 RepID=UPI002F35AB3F
MPEVSIILPVYQAVKYLVRCIDSVLHQEYQDFELICVDDGSRDHSPSILDDYAKRDHRVVVIHQKNAGVSTARNNGLEKVKGTYIQFLDADDWIAPNATMELVRAIRQSNADMVVADFYRVVGSKVARKGSIVSDDVLTLEEYADCMKLSPADFYYGVLWNKLYRHDIIQEYGLKMDPSISYCEDFIFNLEYLLHCHSIAPLQIPIYYYVKTEGSLVTQSLSPSRMLRSRSLVFSYYDAFFRNVLNEEEYRRSRTEIAGYLVSAASDNLVMPMAPGTMKLGKETVQAVWRTDGSFHYSVLLFYLHKAYETQLNTVAIKNNLELEDVLVFEAVRNSNLFSTLREIMDFTGLSYAATAGSVQKLVSRHLLHIEIMNSFHIKTGSRSQDLSNDIDTALADLRNIAAKGLDKSQAYQMMQYLRTIVHNLETFVHHV